jgi:hypothetical protein
MSSWAARAEKAKRGRPNDYAFLAQSALADEAQQMVVREEQQYRAPSFATARPVTGRNKNDAVASSG